VARKLLLADDSVTIQRVIELTFADEDVQVLAVGNGREAIERVASESPDIVLADVGMPERDGYEVAAFIKSDPKLAHIPVLLLTGAFEPIDEVRAKSVKCDGVLVKPFEPQMVISRVRELLAGAPAQPVSESAAAPTPPAKPSASTAPAAPDPVAASATAAKAEGKDRPQALDEYFDRLDAAFAKLGTTVSPVPPAPGPEPVISKSGDVSAPEAVPARSAPVSSPMPTSIPTLNEAFAALLSAEQGHPIAPRPESSQALSNEAIEEIVRRVIARMADSDMRRAVLDTAERLVREEIDRIKQGHRV
jgi:CheY-like chemotaxis protein